MVGRTRPAPGREGRRPSPGAPVLEVSGLAVNDDRGPPGGRRRRPDRPRGRGARHRRRAGQRADRTGRGHHGPAPDARRHGGARRACRCAGRTHQADPAARASATCPRTAASTGWSRSSPSPRTWCSTCTTGRRSASRFALDLDAIAESAKERIEQFDIRTSVGTRRRPARCPAATSRRSSWPGRSPARSSSSSPRSRPAGVDVGSIEFIHGQIMHERDIGTAVLLVSSELDEVVGAGRPDRGDVPGPDPRDRAAGHPARGDRPADGRRDTAADAMSEP